MFQLRHALSILAVLILFMTPARAGEEPFIVLASTTSTQNSGLFDHLLPRFHSETGIGVRVVAVGTGQALRLARNGDADVLLVHHRPSEERFVAEGFGVKRFDVMFNDFIIVGPTADPAGIGGARGAAEALRRIARAKAPFLSRGDDSGTHKKELEIWRATGYDVHRASGTWYREAGGGMGATLNTAVAMDAYTLSDRGTWLAFGNKERLAVLAEKDPRLVNPYGVILVDPKKHPHVKAALGQVFIDWLVGPGGQAAITGYRIGGHKAFVPHAGG
jgi:tungstate transport system substrate-binding protein